MSEPLGHDENGVLVHLMVVGFHHKKGCLVEFCYPPLSPNALEPCDLSPTDEKSPSTTPSPESQEGCSSTGGLGQVAVAVEGSKECLSAKVESVRLPSIWQTLPSLAIPDGAHNFDSDTVFFHLPQLEDCIKTSYCVACYRQIPTKELLVRTSDMTRSSVQKSVVAIMRLPFYGLVEYKLEIVTKAYFNQRDFSQTQVLRDTFHNINRQFSPSILDSPELLTGLSVRSLFNRFGSQVIILFKLLLLEKKTIFITSPIRDLSAYILTLCSLIPGLVQEGLVHSAIPFDVKANGETGLLNRIRSKENVSSGVSTSTNTSTNESTKQLCDIATTTASASPPPPSVTVTDLDLSQVTIATDPTISQPSQSISSIPKSESALSLAQSSSGDASPPPEEESEEETQKRFDTIISRPHMYYGLPLQLFTCSSYLLPYFSMPYFDVLVNERVRSCVAGSSNQIFKRWESDIDVFVMDNQVEIDDPQLKRILRPTVEDMNFMSFMIKAIVDNHDPSIEADIFDESQHIFYEGSDEWIRCHFKNYLLHLLTCSQLEENSREYRAFNPLFMSAWKATHNYKAWSSGPYTAACQRDIDPAHPFSSNRLSNIRFKITNLLSFNRPDLMMNQPLNKQSISNALNSARTTVNSWFTNLSNKAQAVATGTTTWNNYIGSGASGGADKPGDSNGNKANKPSSSQTSIPKLKKEIEKESFVFYPGNGDENPDEDETSV